MLDAALGQAALCTWCRGPACRGTPPEPGRPRMDILPADGRLTGQESQPFRAASASIMDAWGRPLGLFSASALRVFWLRCPRVGLQVFLLSVGQEGAWRLRRAGFLLPGLHSISRDHASWTGEQSLRSALGQAGGLQEDVLLAACNAWKPPRLIF